MKKKIIISVIIIILILIISFVVLFFLFVNALNASLEAAGNEIFSSAAEGIVSGLIEGGKKIADELVSEGVSHFASNLR